MSLSSRSYACGKYSREAAQEKIGRYLTSEEVVHHIDGDPTNDHPDNLLVCPDKCTHMMVHRQKRALDACGNEDWRICCYCKEHSDVNDMIVKGTGYCHYECHKEYERRRYAKKKRALYSSTLG